MTGFICSITYLIIMMVVCYICKSEYQKALRINNVRMEGKLRPFSILLVALLFTLLNIYCTLNSVSMGSDRINYNMNFMGVRKSPSVGLELIFSLVRMFSNRIETVFYLTTFLCCCIVFWAYRNWWDADSKAIVFLLSTNFVFFSFTGLKQIYACAFAALFFSLCMKPRTLKRDIMSISLIIFACAFHSTGFILIPIFVSFLILDDNTKYTKIIIISMLLLLIFMKPIFMVVARWITKIFPYLATKIYEYFASETRQMDEGSTIAFIKGFPYYILLLWGGLNRKKLLSKFKNYDKYLILSALGTVFAISSVISYWLSRFVYIFYLPMGVFYSILMRYESRNNRCIIGFLIIGSSLFFTLRSVALTFINFGGY